MRSASKSILALAAGMALLVSGCGGGSGVVTPPVQPPVQTAAAVTFHGVAARGAPLSGATIVVTDATGAQVGTAIAAADGSYSVTLSAGAKAPFVISATSGEVVFFSPAAVAQTGTINITSLTNLIAAQLSPTGDPSALASQIASGTATVTSVTVNQVVTAIETALAPLLQNVGDSTDPISGTFNANGTGHDRLLMALDIAIIPTTTGSNIVVTVKSATGDGAQPPAIAFSSGQTPPALPTTVATATLPASNTDALVADFMSRLTACYALPVTTRATGTTAASVTAPECKTLFLNDDPTTYLNNGVTVGLNGAYPSLFKDGATGTVFSSPQVRFVRADGSLLITFAATGSGGTTYSNTLIKNQNGVFKAVGNDYQYQVNIRPWSEFRDFINNSAFSYWATGVDVNVKNQTSGGTPIFDHVVVTAPNGKTINLVPSAGLSYLPVDGTSGTSVVRLAGKFVNSATSGVPRRLTSGGFENLAWAPNPDSTDTDWTDAQVQSINNVGSWKVDFYLTSAPTTIAATQYHQTWARPLAISELQTRQWATPSAAARADAVAGTSSTGYYAFQAGDTIQLDVSPTTPPDWWTVPTGALPPTVISAQGYVANVGSPAPRWNDSASVSASARTALIRCSPQTNSDPHCGPTAGTYSTNTRLNLVQLIAYDVNNMEWISNNLLALLAGATQ